jgi:adenylate cyclase class IV
MPANVEIKARVKDPQALLARARRLSDTRDEIIRQRDTFFRIPDGRLKLRDFGDGQGELIYYQRPDHAGPKVSDYAISRTGDPAGLAALLAKALPVIGVVAKTRTLLLKGRTRIHIDEVQDLGWFMELEVVLSEGESPESGHEEAQELMAKLGIGNEDLLEGAYLDMLQGNRPL